VRGCGHNIGVVERVRHLLNNSAALDEPSCVMCGYGTITVAVQLAQKVASMVERAQHLCRHVKDLDDKPIRQQCPSVT
jgi:hypothetical protein